MSPKLARFLAATLLFLAWVGVLGWMAADARRPRPLNEPTAAPRSNPAAP